MLSSRTRSGAVATVTDGHKAVLNFVLASDGALEYETVVNESAANLPATKTALVKPRGHGNYLLPDPKIAAKSWSKQSWDAGKLRRNGDDWPQHQKSLAAMPTPCTLDQKLENVEKGLSTSADSLPRVSGKPRDSTRE